MKVQLKVNGQSASVDVAPRVVPDRSLDDGDDEQAEAKAVVADSASAPRRRRRRVSSEPKGSCMAVSSL